MEDLNHLIIAASFAFVALVLVLPQFRQHLSGRARRIATVGVVALAAMLVALGVAITFIE
jgi:hypothetical protein